MTDHELKTINPYFSDVWSGRKTFEIRKDDRGFKIGDTLTLREYDLWWKTDDDNHLTGREGKYSGRSIFCEITYILPAGRFEGLAERYCALGIKVLRRSDASGKKPE